MKPRGIRNNNPLNIRHNANKYQGEMAGSDKSFKTFASMPYGYRAAFVTLATYLLRGRNTIEKIINRWAPPSENNTEKYIKNVEKYSEIPRNKELTCTDGTDYIRIVAAMSFIDTIRIPYPIEANHETKKNLSGWLNFQIWCGRFALISALLIVAYFILKRRL